MRRDIKLPRSVSGSELVSACERAAAELGWKISKKQRSYSVQYGTRRGGLKTRGVELEFKTRRFFGPGFITSSDIDPTHNYSELGIYSPYDLGSPYGLTERQLESFVSTLFKVLRQNF